MSAKFKTGQLATFKKYGSLDDDQKPILKEGEQVKITKIVDDETYIAVAVEDKSREDQVFEEEIEVSEAKAEAPAKRARAKKATEPDDEAEESEETTAVPKLKRGKKAPALKAPPVEAKKSTKGKGKAPEAEKPKKVEEELEVLPASSYSQSVQKVTKTDGAALKAAKTLVEKIGENFWTLGGILSFIRRHKSYKSLKNEAGELLYDGKKGFDRYVETELEMAYRKAMYYIDIHETFAPLGIDETRLLGLGWSKVKELTGVVDSENVEEWLEKAQELGRDDLQAEIKTSTVAAGEKGSKTVTPTGETAKMTKMTFRLFEDQGTVAMEALAQAKEACGGDDNAAFAHIASEWLSLNSGDASSIPIDEAFKTLENRYSLNDVKKYIKAQYK